MASSTSKLNRAEIPPLGPERPVVWPRGSGANYPMGWKLHWWNRTRFRNSPRSYFFAAGIRSHPFRDWRK